MASNDPRDEERSEPAGSETDPGAMRGRLEERLDRASEAAERLFAEAGTAARGPRTPPPSGWQTPEADGEARERRAASASSRRCSRRSRSLRELIPPDLQRRLADALRELLLALRALIDWYLERAKHGRAEPAEVQDIPIAWRLGGRAAGHGGGGGAWRRAPGGRAGLNRSRPGPGGHPKRPLQATRRNRGWVLSGDPLLRA